jgi:hypothetical protein
MALNPAGSTLLLTIPACSLSATLIVESLSYAPSFEEFDRMEFDNERLRSARNLCGQKRQIIENLAGTPIQIVTSCGDTTQVPLGPNSDTNFNNIKKRFDVLRFEIQGATSEAEDVNTLYTVARDHQARLARFKHYLARSSGGDTPYETLIALQSETFSYLTSTGMTIAGTSLENSESNMLITSLNIENTLSIPTGTPGVHEFYKTFKVTIEQRVISNLYSI